MFHKGRGQRYVLKEEALETIVEAIRAVSRGELWLSKRVQEKVKRRR